MCQRRHNHANPVIAQRLKDRKPYLAKAKSLAAINQAQKAAILEMGYNSSVFYGAEVDPPTEKQLQKARTSIHAAVYPTNKTQEPHIALAWTRT